MRNVFKIIGFLPGLTRQDFVTPIFVENSVLGIEYIGINDRGYYKFEKFNRDEKSNLILHKIKKKNFREGESFRYYYKVGKKMTTIVVGYLPQAYKFVAKNNIDPLQRLMICEKFELPKRHQLKLIFQAAEEVHSFFEPPAISQILHGILDSRDMNDIRPLLKPIEKTQIYAVDYAPQFQLPLIKKPILDESEIENEEFQEMVPVISPVQGLINIFPNAKGLESWFDENKDGGIVKLNEFRRVYNLLRQSNNDKYIQVLIDLLMKSKVLFDNKKSYRLFLDILQDGHFLTHVSYGSIQIYQVNK
ncbi:MAG: hypothetical protein ACXWQQ_05615, partial [Pseudobdellovibrio sp.]